jgi:hypothetical protein
MLFDIENEIDERRYLLLMFAQQASETHAFVRDQNANELPIPLQNKRAMIAELDGLIGQIRAGYVRLSDLTQRARPLVGPVESARPVLRDLSRTDPICSPRRVFRTRRDAP